MMSIDETKSWSERLDKMGMSASMFCAIHCALMPIVIGVLPLIGLQVLGSHAIEDTVIVGAFIIASLSLVPSYFRVHRKMLALVLFVLGFGALILGHAITQQWLGVPLAVTGGLGVAIAHWVNHRECKNCPRCQDGCDHAH
ncbi:MAG: MerC domain-containing protein [Candidatus Hydrogenedentota bacterium]